MMEFEAFELRGGWIQGLGRIDFKESPVIGESVEIAGAHPKELRRYEVLDIELTTGSPSAGNIVLTPIREPNNPPPFADSPGNSRTTI